MRNRRALPAMAARSAISYGRRVTDSKSCPTTDAQCGRSKSAKLRTKRERRLDTTSGVAPFSGRARSGAVLIVRCPRPCRRDLDCGASECVSHAKAPRHGEAWSTDCRRLGVPTRSPSVADVRTPEALQFPLLAQRRQANLRCAAQAAPHILNVLVRPIRRTKRGFRPRPGRSSRRGQNARHRARPVARQAGLPDRRAHRAG